MAFVLDASMTGSWAFEDERSALAEMVFDRLESEWAVVPAIWWFEVRNLVVMNERRGRITREKANGFIQRLGSLAIVIDDSPHSDDLLRMARDRRLTVYDAAYLELAMRLNLSLATLDSRLVDAAKEEGVVVV